ncbi:MAG: metal-dependent hydrolase [Burkholderiales bacterium]|nr:metal-dependent hydrolase [Burkholderiales bacterium]
MLVDLIIGLCGGLIALVKGYEWNSIIVFFAAFVLDIDIVINEFYRIFIKKEKKFGIENFLDEYSYTHKFIFHLPLVALPIVFVSGLFYKDAMFGFLVFLMVFYHLFHDTVDKNFDGVSWLWPLSKSVFKLRANVVEIKSRDHLFEEAMEMEVKNPRNTKSILKDNSIT